MEPIDWAKVAEAVIGEVDYDYWKEYYMAGYADPEDQAFNQKRFAEAARKAGIATVEKGQER